MSPTHNQGSRLRFVPVFRDSGSVIPLWWVTQHGNTELICIASFCLFFRRRSIRCLVVVTNPLNYIDCWKFWQNVRIKYMTYAWNVDDKPKVVQYCKTKSFNRRVDITHHTGRKSHLLFPNIRQICQHTAINTSGIYSQSPPNAKTKVDSNRWIISSETYIPRAL